MIGVKLKSLEAFCVAVEEKSISAAARQIYLSQPRVSERLAELERVVGLSLLQRSRHGVQPTVEGEIFYKQARKVLNEVDALRSVVQNLQDKRDRKLRFASCMTVGERLLPEWLWRFKKDMPEIVPMVFMGNDPQVLSLVKSGDAPIGIVASDECYDCFESTPILYDELVVAVAPTHPWSRRRCITPKDLATEPFIAREEGSAIRNLIEQTLKNQDEEIVLDVQMELGSITAIKEVVEEGWAFSIFSRADIQRKLEAGTLVEVEGFSIPWSFKLIRHSSATLSLAEQRFYDFLIEMHKHGNKALTCKIPEMTSARPIVTST